MDLLVVIIINYKDEVKTIDYIKNEICKISFNHKIVVVNNESNNESDLFLTKSLNGILVNNIFGSIDLTKVCYVISQHENLGYARANNSAAIFAKFHFNATYYLFSNNDIKIISDNLVEQLICKLKSLPHVALIGPRVLGLDGLNQSPEPYISVWSKYLWMYLITPFVSMNFKKKIFKLDYSDKALEGNHYKIMGAFFIINAYDFENCNMMDNHTFLYAEEVILSERLMSIGKQCYFFPDVSIIHEHGFTISKYINTYFKSLLIYDSESYYYRKYKNVSCLSIFFIRLIYRLILTLKIKFAK